MRSIREIVFGLFLIVVISACKSDRTVDLDYTPNRGFRSNTPAINWERSLVTGNGTLGAMVMGHPYSDTIIFNHTLLYLPLNEPLPPVSQGEELQYIRQLMLEGEFGKASRHIVETSHKEGFGPKRWTDPIIPAFDLIMGVENDSDQTYEPENYVRTVNFETGEAEVKWQDERGAFSRSTFASRSDNMVITRLISNGEKVSYRFGLGERYLAGWWGGIDRRTDTGFDEVDISTEGSTITYRATFKNRWDGLFEGYEGVVRFVNSGGKLEIQGNEIVITGAREILIFVVVEPIEDITVSKLDDLKANLKRMPSGYSRLLKSHTDIHGELFNRVQLNIGGDSDLKKLPVEELFTSVTERSLPSLIELAFDASRYNIISSTGVNPPNLQGLWSGTLTPPWSGDFTMNGNVPVAVSSMLNCNTPELKLSLFDMLERHIDDFKINSQLLFNTGGIHVPSRMSTHGLNNHFDATWPMTFWTGGAGWYSMFYYDYYLHTNDLAFLKERALPFMEQSVRFYEEFLIPGPDGKYIFIPSYSPENSPGNIPYQACINATMDVMIAKQLLRNTISASKILDVNSHLIEKWESILSNLPDYEVNEKGELREWLWPGVEENHSHRHVSQFYALFDIMDPEFKENPKLIEGARRVIEEKMRYRRAERGGIMSFGMAQLSFAASMIGEAKVSYEMLEWLTRNFWFNNMVSTHDPQHIFNLDLSGGYPSVIIKMLFYSEPGLIKLFPALYSSMPVGEINGVLLRGNIVADKLRWNEKSVEFTFTPRTEQEISLVLPSAIENFTVSGADMIGELEGNTIRLKLKDGVPVSGVIELTNQVYRN